LSGRNGRHDLFTDPAPLTIGTEREVRCRVIVRVDVPAVQARELAASVHAATDDGTPPRAARMHAHRPLELRCRRAIVRYPRRGDIPLVAAPAEVRTAVVTRRPE